MANGDTRLDDGLLPGIRRQFVAHGYAGHVLVLDDQPDEAVFLVAVGALASVRDRALCMTLQGIVGRKVWVIEESDEWLKNARRLW
jgi:hypothetical protein